MQIIKKKQKNPSLGDILSAIERDVIRRTQEAKHILEQRSSITTNGGNNGSLTILQQQQQLPSGSSIMGSPITNMTFKREPQTIIEQQPQQQLINVCQMPLNNNLPPGAQFATIQQQGVHSGGSTSITNLSGNIIGQDLKTGITTKYVSYMQVIILFLNTKIKIKYFSFQPEQLKVVFF